MRSRSVHRPQCPAACRRLHASGALLLHVLLAAGVAAADAGWTTPFLCDADLDLYRNDNQARIVSPGGPVTFYARGLQAVRLDGRTLAPRQQAPNLRQVELPAGTWDIELVRNPAAAPLPDGAPPFMGRPATVASAAELEAWLAAARPGAEIVIRNGVYRDWKVTIRSGGAPGRPVVIRPQTPGGVLFMGWTALRVEASHVVLRELRFSHVEDTALRLDRANHCRVTQCQFEQCGSSLSSFGHVLGVGWDSHSNRVDHCLFLNSKSMSLGQTADSYPKPDNPRRVGTGNRFDCNVFRDIYRLWRNGQEAIQIGQGKAPRLAPATLIEYNVFENASGDIEIISIKSSGNTVRHNLFVDCDGCLTLRNGNENIVAANVLRSTVDGVSVRGERHCIVNNLFVNLQGAAVLLHTGKQDDETYGAVRQCLIAHNTAVACGSGLRTEEPAADATAAPPEANRALHNLFVGSQGTLVRLGHPSHVQLQGNLFWATGTAAVGVLGENAVVADPRLGGDWLPLIPGPGSPAIDAVASLPDVPDDFWGVPRPQGPHADLGAMELGARAPLLRLPELPPRRQSAATDTACPCGPVAWLPTGDVRAAKGVWTGQAGTLRLTSGLTPDFVLEWEYQPAAFTSRFSVAFGGTTTDDGYRLMFGGAVDDPQEGIIPAGVIWLAKGVAGSVILQAPHSVDYRANYRHGWSGNTRKIPFDHPIPGFWTKFRLQRSGRFLRLKMTNVSIFPDGRARGGAAAIRTADVPTGMTPVLLWEDTGEVEGSVPLGSVLELGFAGQGACRQLRLE